MSTGHFERFNTTFEIVISESGIYRCVESSKSTLIARSARGNDIRVLKYYSSNDDDDTCTCQVQVVLEELLVKSEL